MLADTLHQILKEKGKGSSRTASAFCADHSFSKFKEEVLKFLYSALPQFGHSTLYMVGIEARNYEHASFHTDSAVARANIFYG